MCGAPDYIYSSSLHLSSAIMRSSGVAILFTLVLCVLAVNAVPYDYYGYGTYAGHDANRDGVADFADRNLDGKVRNINDCGIFSAVALLPYLRKYICTSYHSSTMKKVTHDCNSLSTAGRQHANGPLAILL